MNSMKYEVKLDLGALLNGVNSHVMAAALPTIHQAVKAIASETAYRWKDGVAKNLWGTQLAIDGANDLMEKVRNTADWFDLDIANGKAGE